jgi:hypothetical protein
MQNKTSFPNYLGDGSHYIVTIITVIFILGAFYNFKI